MCSLVLSTTQSRRRTVFDQGFPGDGWRVDVGSRRGRCTLPLRPRESEPRLAVKEVLEEVLTGEAPGADEVVHPGVSRLDIWYRSAAPDGPERRVAAADLLFPHDHRMWAAIGIYGGQEDNTYYRRRDGGIVVAGGRQLRAGHVLVLGDDAIHEWLNPLARYAGAVHVYGGDFVTTQRSQWEPRRARRGARRPQEGPRTVRRGRAAPSRPDRGDRVPDRRGLASPDARRPKECVLRLSDEGSTRGPPTPPTVSIP